MKVHQVTDHHLNSGIGRYSLELTKALRAADHQVRLYKPYKTTGDDVAFDRAYPWIRKVRYKSLRSLHSYLLPYFIGGTLLPTQADCYHAHWFMAGLGLMKARKKRMVVTMHDVSLLHEKEKDSQFTAYYKKTLAQFKERDIPIIVVSESAKQDAIRHAGFDDEQIHAIHNGINFDQFFPLILEEQRKFKLVYTGGLSPRKNLQLLLDACKILEDRNFDYQLQVAGNHPNSTPYPQQSRELGLKNVAFIGFVPDDQLNDFYNRADLMVYTSKYEGFGFAPLEAMAAGLPVISTKGGSLQEVSGGGAYMIDDSAEELAEAIIHLAHDQAAQEALSARGRSWVKQFTWERTAEKTLNLYQTLLS